MENESFLYFDDSKHDSAGFYLGAFVYSETDMNDEIEKMFIDNGLNPNETEFKSSMRMDRNPQYKKVRADFREYLLTKRIAIVISPANEKYFQEIICESLINLVEANKSEIKLPLKIYLDEGIIKLNNHNSIKSVIKFAKLNNIEMNIEQDSKIIKGIQLADYAAHSCSVMLKEQLGLIDKKTNAGYEMGYDTDIEIGFELWAYLRNSFFSVYIPFDIKNGDIPFQVNVENYGLFISPKCTEEIKSASLNRFGKMYLGCTH